MHTIAFPKIADYDIPALYLFKSVTDYKIIKPIINLETMELGSNIVLILFVLRLNIL